MAIEKDAGHDVESVSQGAARFRRMASEPGVGAVAEPSLLAGIDGFCGLAVACAAPALDLDEHQRHTAARDQIELDAIGADVACDDAITSLREIAGGRVLAESPERGPVIAVIAVIVVFAVIVRGAVLRSGQESSASSASGSIRGCARGRTTRIGMGTLHIVATPIGNLEDVTLRALRVLREADWVLAEDTRRTRILLDHFEIQKTPTSLHAHNEASRIDQVHAALGDGRSVALVSDAGTPLVSDPGARLVAAIAAAGHRVEAVPGASALLSALCVAGLDTGQVLFLGFLPRKQGEQTRLLERQRGREETIVLFESPHRVAATFELLARVLGDRPACLARELTKRHEEVLRGSLSELSAHCLAHPPRGECTLVVAGASEADDLARTALTESELDVVIDADIQSGLARGESTRDLASAIAAKTGRPRRAVYARALALRGEGASPRGGARS